MPKHKLTGDQIVSIKRMFRAGRTNTEIAAKYGVNQSTIGHLLGHHKKSTKPRYKKPNPSPIVYRSPKPEPTTYATYLERAGIQKPRLY